MPNNKSWRWSMYPKLHSKVSNLLTEDNLHFKFYDVDDDKSCTESYDTNVMGKFTCNNPNCTTNAWSSRKIAITIRMYDGGRYNARVYNQHCRACNRASRPHLDAEAYAERIAYRIKKWNGIEQEVPHFSRKPLEGHESELCEGCKAGHCTG